MNFRRLINLSTLKLVYFKENIFMHNYQKIFNFLIILTLLLFSSYYFVKTPGFKNKVKNQQKYVIYECIDSFCSGWADRVKGKFNFKTNK